LLRSVFFTDLNTGWVTGISSMVYKTTNGGGSWVMAFNNSMCGLYTLFFVNSLTGWTAGCEGVILYTSNGGINWTLQSIASTSYLYSVCFSDSQTGWAAGAGGKILKTTNGGITAVTVSGTGVPYEFSLSQNYPNPFNPATTFRFSIPENSFVQLVIYNSLGAEIETLVDEELHPAVYEAKWDASKYPSGVYFYRIETLNFSNTKKMILAR
jgi:hypothetical protein